MHTKHAHTLPDPNIQQPEPKWSLQTSFMWRHGTFFEWTHSLLFYVDF